MQPFALANAPTTAAQQLAAVNSVLPGFFETLRIPLVAGRYIDSRAIDYVNRIEKKIILIDGRQLANLSIDFRVGVTEVTSYTIKKIDLDYFEED
jgi:restriction endonuclease Mrr